MPALSPRTLFYKRQRGAIQLAWQRLNLHHRFVLLVVLLFVFTGSIAGWAFYEVMASVLDKLARQYAEKQVLYDNATIRGPIIRELALARQLVTSPLLLQWAQDETNVSVRESALRELDSYRQTFHDGSWFYAIDSSRNYYYNDRANQYADRLPLHMLRTDDPNDSWYFETMRQIDDYALNVDYDAFSKTTKIWINVIIKHKQKKLGVAGTGIDLSEFLRRHIQNRPEDVQTVLIDALGITQVDRDPRMIVLNSFAQNKDQVTAYQQLLDNPQQQQLMRDQMEALRHGVTEAATVQVTRQGQPQLIGIAYMPEIGWYNLTVIDLAHLQSQWQVPSLLAVAGSLLLIVAIGVAWLLHRMIFRRMEPLFSAAQRMTQGDYAIQLPPDRDDEIGRLTNSFQRMATTIDGHTKQLGHIVSERTLALQQSYSKFKTISEIGAQITATLDLDTVLLSLYRCLNTFMNAPTFAIPLYREQGDCLEITLAIQDGNILPPFTRAMNDQNSLASWCARERKSILINDFENEAKNYLSNPALNKPPITQTDGSPFRVEQSRMFVPLIVKEKLLGIMAVMSSEKNAYQSWHLDILQSLASYAATAIDNAQTHLALQEAHKNLQTTQQQLLLQEKMASLGTLTAGIAHEINNPTHFAHMSAQNLVTDLHLFESYLQDLIDPEEASELPSIIAQRFQQLQDHASTVLNGTSRIRQIVRDLHTITRHDEAEPDKIIVSDLLSSTLQLVRPGFAEQVTFEMMQGVNPIVYGWPAQLNQLFMNLMVNACEAIVDKPGGNGQPHGCLRICLTADQDFAIIEFHDDGVGIPLEKQARIFEPFFTTKPVGTGIGLGLSLSYQIAANHGGMLNFVSHPGQGSTFTVRLPLYSDEVL